MKEKRHKLVKVLFEIIKLVSTKVLNSVKNVSKNTKIGVLVISVIHPTEKFIYYDLKSHENKSI